MRVAILNQFAHVAGGVETYLSHLLPELARRDCNISFWHEVNIPLGQQRVQTPDSSIVHSIADLGISVAARLLSTWHPDVIFSQGSMNQEWNTLMYDIAPVVQFVHVYYGTCISGQKAWKFPTPRPCNHRFGWECLAHYFPHRCGGLSPLTMIQNYALQSRRLEVLRGCSAILTASAHMRDEFLKHGFSPDRVKVAGLFLPEPQVPPPEPMSSWRTPELRLLFCGRMVWLKGGDLLLNAVPLFVRCTDRPLHISFLGDGPERGNWQRRAALLTKTYPGVRIEFLPWSSRDECEAIYRQHDLLVVPSIWPEPFGLTGPEAAQQGLPAVAFDTGGIRDWLTDGVNGHLASANPPTAGALAEAIIKATSDPKHYQELRQGALQGAHRFNLHHHLQILMATFESVCKSA